MYIGVLDRPKEAVGVECETRFCCQALEAKDVQLERSYQLLAWVRYGYRPEEEPEHYDTGLAPVGGRAVRKTDLGL